MKFANYRKALLSAGPKVKEMILQKAAQDKKISFPDFLRLVELANPDAP